MKKTRLLGIWMDHSSAHLMVLSDDQINTTIIESTFTHQEKEKISRKGESHMHNKEQQQQNAFYKKLGNAIKQYTDVLLFGPTNAKVELLNTLKEDHVFDNIKINVIDSDKLTENQQYAFVNNYFENLNRI